MTLTKNNLPKLVKSWYDYNLSTEETNVILNNIKASCEEYGEIDETALCEIIGDTIYN